MSFGISISTGPGLPVEAMKKASAITRGNSSTERTRKLCFVTLRVMPVVSASWKASVPIKLMPTCPEMTTRGTPSIIAVASPVTALVAPGPEVTRAHPTFPVARA